jgi:anti-sigma regulatory factor (Ser/Thr protein kinase)
MGKIATERIYDSGKELATKTGQELKNFIGFVTSAFTEVVIALKGGLTYEDNYNCKIVTVELVNAITQVISAKSGLQTIKEIRVRQVVSTLYGMDTFHWYTDGDGSVKVLMTFTGSPAASTRINVVLLILYG